MGHDVGIIGLGVLGSAIAKNIVAGGRSVLGFDRAEVGAWGSRGRRCGISRKQR